MEIFNVPRDTIMNGLQIIAKTVVVTYAPSFVEQEAAELHRWIKNTNSDEKYALHRICSSFEPQLDAVHEVILERGLQAFNERNSIDITSARYLKENSFVNIAQMDIIRHYILKMMGE